MIDFDKYNILIIGDIMLDKYIYGNIDKISPEAPVPIFEITKMEEKPGGAANVALNIKSLGSNPVLLSITGDDRDGNVLLDLLKENDLDTKNILQIDSKITTVKTRLIASGQQMLRIDEEDTSNIDDATQDLLKNNFLSILEKQNIDAIIFQDYNKGLLKEDFINFVMNKAKENDIFVAVDPKFHNFFNYKNADLFKPNLKEIEIALNRKIGNNKEELQRAAIDLYSALNYKNLFITLGERGIFYSDGQKTEIYPTKQIDVVDVSGAGDVVISTATLAYLNGMKTDEVAILSNLAGGLACEIMGVATITLEQLKKVLSAE